MTAECVVSVGKSYVNCLLLALINLLKSNVSHAFYSIEICRWCSDFYIVKTNTRLTASLTGQPG